MLDNTGALDSQQRYTPFGGVRSGIGPVTETDFGYTGQRDLGNSSDLMDYNARFYGPVLGRFTQADTIIPSMANPQTLNRYSYVNNNPLNYIDPSGHMFLEPSAGAGCTPTSTDYLASCNIGGVTRNEPISWETPGVLQNPEPDDEKNVVEEIVDEIITYINDEESMNNLANDAQDVATTASVWGASMEILGATLGCLLGPSLMGCGAGYGVGRAASFILTNPIETLASWVSVGATIQTGRIRGENSLNPLRMNESTATSIVTQGIGTVTTSGINDSVIDIYSSGFNKGYFPGVYSLPIIGSWLEGIFTE